MWHAAPPGRPGGTRCRPGHREGLAVIDRTTSSIDALAANMSDAMAEVEGLAQNSEDRFGAGSDPLDCRTDQPAGAQRRHRGARRGRPGFAVVADEVRNLAQRTQESVEKPAR